MAANPKEQKEVLDWLVRHGSCDLTKVLETFFSQSKKPNLQAAVIALRTLQGEGVFEVVDSNDTDAGGLSIKEDMFNEPERYQLRLRGFLANDANISSMNKMEVGEDVEEIEPYYNMVTLKDYDVVNFVGDIQDCIVTCERLRAFTQYFASLLIRRELETAAQLFSSTVSDKFSVQWFEEKFTNLEAIYGRFDFFDHLRVFSVYAGEGSDKNFFDEIKLPKGVKRSARVGESSFKLVSVYSPNGVAIYDYTVSIAVIEEDGSLKICDCNWFSGN